jgi:hypothetical protein
LDRVGVSRIAFHDSETFMLEPYLGRRPHEGRDGMAALESLAGQLRSGSTSRSENQQSHRSLHKRTMIGGSWTTAKIEPSINEFRPNQSELL